MTSRRVSEHPPASRRAAACLAAFGFALFLDPGKRAVGITEAGLCIGGPATEHGQLRACAAGCVQRAGHHAFAHLYGGFVVEVLPEVEVFAKVADDRSVQATAGGHVPVERDEEFAPHVLAVVGTIVTRRGGCVDLGNDRVDRIGRVGDVLAVEERGK